MHIAGRVQALVRAGVVAAILVLALWQVAFVCHQSDLSQHQNGDTCEFCLVALHAAGAPTNSLVVPVASPVVPASVTTVATEGMDACVYQGRAPPLTHFA